MDQAKKLQEKYKLTFSENPWLTLDSASLEVFFKLERLSLGSEFGLGSKPRWINQKIILTRWRLRFLAFDGQKLFLLSAWSDAIN